MNEEKKSIDAGHPTSVPMLGNTTIFFSLPKSTSFTKENIYLGNGN